MNFDDSNNNTNMLHANNSYHITIYTNTPIEFRTFIDNEIRQLSSSNIESIKDAIKEKMILYYCPYVINSTKSSSGMYYIYYKCGIKNCKSGFRLKFYNGIISDTKSEWQHDHTMDRMYLESNYFMMSNDKKEEICKLRMNGASPGYIRKSLKLAISPDQLYNISRRTIKEKFENEFENLESESYKWNKNYYVINHYKSDDNVFNGITLINRRIVDMPYASDICVIDDTLCMNKYRYPVVAIYCYDENDKAQLLSVGIITGKTFNDFVYYLKDISDYIKPRVFICDRYESQKKAIEFVFQDTHIVFCRVHIKRNVIDHFGNNSNIYTVITKLFNGDINTDDYINTLKNEILQNADKSQHIKLLLEHIKYYAPSETKKLRMRKHYTSNLIEGSFSAIKNWTNHEIVPLSEIINTFTLHSEMLMKKSISTKRLSIDINLYSGMELGSLGRNVLMNEYDLFKLHLNIISSNNPSSQIIKNYLESQNCDCMNLIEYGLPCCHLLYKRYIELRVPLLNETDIPDIYFATNINHDAVETPILQKKDEPKKENYSYSNIMDKISQIASEASRNKDVQNLFDQFFYDFNKLKINQKGSPSFISQSGRPTTRQSLYVEHNQKSGAPKKKSRYHCKLCGKEGHNISTCPSRSNK